MRYLTVEEFAKEVRMCQQSIRRAIHKGWIYASRPGSGVRSPYRIPVTELERINISGMYKEEK